MARNGMTATPKNYKTFITHEKNTGAEAISANAGFEHHPEIGMLFAETPCDNCYELIGKRTETTKTFIKEGTGGKDIMEQTSTMPMHYRDAAGNWRTIKSQLAADNAHAGVYAAYEQESPIAINTAGRFTTMGKPGASFTFNNNLELIYLKPDGTEVSLGAANWTNYTAGNEGVYVTNAWPGIDIEMYVIRNAIKTNFHINNAMPAYANGKLLVRDHMQLDNGLSIYTGGQTSLTGNLEIKDNTGARLYEISTATAYEQHNDKSTLQFLEYHIKANDVDIALPGNFLNRPAASYPVIIDPLVSTPTVTPVTGSTYSTAWTVGCPYLNAANVPANVTVTDIQWSFNYITSGGAWLNEGAVDFVKGACKSPSAGGFYWYCNLFGGGTCTGSNISIFTDLAACVPPPQCLSYPLNITMNFYQDYLTTAPCASTYVSGATPLTITVFGHTVETTAAGATASPSTICAGQTSTLTLTGTYGVPPYTYSWTPGPVAGSPAPVTPAVTTTYVGTVTDACGITATASRTITVNPLTPITGTLTTCVGNTTTLANATPAGTWSSSATSIATIVSTTGIVTGIAPGTANITYTTASGCTATAIVTVTPLPGAITGTLVLCSGLTTALANATPGGTWSNGTGSVATIDAAGLVTGISGGTSTITYSFGGSCYSTAVVTVNQSPVISSTSSTNPTVCGASDGSITLSGLTPGATYVVSYTTTSVHTITLTADGTGSIVMVGFPAGSYTNIKVTTTAGCVSNIVGPIALTDLGTPATPTATNSSPVCSGSIVVLTGVSTTSGVTFNWSGPSGFSAATATTTVNPSAATTGTVYAYTLTVTSAGCTSLPAITIVTVNPIPQIAGTSKTDPTTCFGTDGTITITGLAPGETYTANYLFNGSPATATITTNTAGTGVITGLISGSYTALNVTSAFGCTSPDASGLVLTDPGAPPIPVITANTPLCVGQTLALGATDLVPGGTYSWAGPDGFTSSLEFPQIPNTTMAADGIYTVTYTLNNCISTNIQYVPLYPPITLTNTTASQTIKYGSNIQLNVMGALYYRWTPADGSLSNDNINNPVAAPLDSTTYTVYGTSQWGCMDSAKVTILVDYDMDEFIPSAFSPMGTGTMISSA